MSINLTVKDWPHAPVHRLNSAGVYMVTGATLHKRHFFAGNHNLNALETSLLKLAKQYLWQLEAWSVFSNHYHFVGRSDDSSENLGLFLKHLHGETAIALNQTDDQPGRAVWFNYWETKLTFEKSYLARLSYVHRNPVRHGLVEVANQYPWCSAAWFERTANASMVKTIYGFKIDRLSIKDDY